MPDPIEILDPTGICNLALSHLAVSSEIGNVKTERSKEASACRRFYQPALQESQRDFPNPSLIVTANLALVTDLRAVDGAEWCFAYRYPSDCSKAIRIPSGTRNDTPETKVPYRIMSDASGKLIYTDKENAMLEYSKMSTDPSKWAPDFVMAFSLLLAYYIAPRVTAGDPFKLGERAYRGYLVSSRKSEANAVGEEQAEQTPESSSINARN